MTTENRQGLTQNRSLYHRVYAIRDITVMQNPKGDHDVLIRTLQITTCFKFNSHITLSLEN